MTLAPKFNNVPECLKERDSWLLWSLKKFIKRDGTLTWLKIPYYVDGTRRKGTLGSPTDRAQLGSFAQAKRAYRAAEDRFAGIGFATMADYPLTILDLDGCVEDDKTIDSEFAQRVIDTGTYVELSPSGHGLRAVFTGPAACKGKRNNFLENKERVEIYCGGAFVTITGHKLDDAGVDGKRLPKKIKAELQPVIDGGGNDDGSRIEVDGEALLSPDAAPLPDFSLANAKRVLDNLPDGWGNSGSGTWFKVAAALHLQFDGSQEAYDVLDEWSQGVGGYDPENNKKRWDSGFSHDKGKATITTMRNLVFEAVLNGGMNVKEATMRRWGLKRTAEEDFAEDADEIDEDESAWPKFDQLEHLADIGYMLDHEPEPIEWLIEDFLPRGVVTTLAGSSGVSKSFLIQQMCAAGAVGQMKFAGMKMQKEGFCSLYFAYEDTRRMLHSRIYKLMYRYASIGGGDTELDDKYDEMQIDEDAKEQLRNNMLVLSTEVLDTGDWQLVKKNKKFDAAKVTGLGEYLRQYIKARKIDVLVVDTGSESHSADENNAQDMVVLMRSLRQLAEGTNIAVLVLQHIPKSLIGKRMAEISQAAIRGSSVLVDKSRNVFMLCNMQRDDAPMYGIAKEDCDGSYIVLVHVKANLGRMVDDKVFTREDGGLLSYRSKLKKLDPETLRDAVAEEKEEEYEEKAMAKNVKFIKRVQQFVHEQNNEGVRPSKNAVVGMLKFEYGVAQSTAIQCVEYMIGKGDLMVGHTGNGKKHTSSLLYIPEHPITKGKKALPVI